MLDSTTTSFSVSSPGIAGTMTRFPLGSYIQVDNEIMRVASSSLSGTPIDNITVIRGALATSAASHVENSTIRKIKVPSIEFHRPSIIRASGHTFEYLGYGPGNYSTALPQVQDRTLTEREEFLSQAQERGAGLVVYTGMNNKGDFYIGNQKKSSATGEEITFDTPIPTITGQDPSTNSVVFDEVIIKNNLVVEGGASGQVLSQFDGPVTFDGKIKATDLVKISNPINSNGPTSGALVVTGGAGIGKNLTVGGDINITANVDAAGGTFGNIQIGVTDDNTIDTTTGNLILNSVGGTVNVTDALDVDGNLNVDGTSQMDQNVNMSSGLTVAGVLDVNTRADIDNVRIDGNTVSTTSSKLILDSTSGEVEINDNLDLNGTLNVSSTSIFVGEVTFNTGIIPDTDEGAYVGTAAKPFSEAHFGEIRIADTNDNTIDTATGNLILNSAGGTIDINDNVDISGTLTVAGTTNLNGNVDLGNATGDTITAIGSFDSDLVPSANGVRDLGASTSEWKDLYIDGTAKIDTLTVDGNGGVAGTFTVNGQTVINDSLFVQGSNENFTIRNGSNVTKFIVDTDNGNTTIGGVTNITNTTDNTLGNPNTGALRVDGGVGIDKNLTVAGTIAGNVTGNLTGNAATATKLAATKNIGGVAFDGSSNINLPGVNSAGNQNTTGNAATATTATTASKVTTSENSAPSFQRIAFHSQTSGPANLRNDFGLQYNPSNNKLSVSGAGAFGGDITAFASDERLKTNISPITDALFKVNSLNGFTYNFNEIAGGLGFDTEIDYAGVSAQEVQKVLPEVVRPAPVDDKYITVQYDKLTALLIEAVKELSDKVEKLEQKLSDK